MESRIAIHRVAEKCAQTTVITTVSGTAIRTLAMPHTQLQNARAKTMAAGDKDKLRPWSKISYYNLNYAKPDENHGWHSPCLKLDQSEQRRRYDADEISSHWDVIQKKIQDTPDDNQIKAPDSCPKAARDAGQDTG